MEGTETMFGRRTSGAHQRGPPPLHCPASSAEDDTLLSPRPIREGGRARMSSITSSDILIPQPPPPRVESFTSSDLLSPGTPFRRPAPPKKGKARRPGLSPNIRRFLAPYKLTEDDLRPEHVAVLNKNYMKARRIPMPTGEPALPSPGPGQYNLPVLLSSTGPRFVRPTRPTDSRVAFADTVGLASPGPAAYTLPTPSGPSFRLQFRKPGFDRPTETDPSSPGPGDLDVRIKAQAPAVSMGVRCETKFGDDDIPGPGSYEVQSSLSTRSCTIGTRFPLMDATYTISPGPGAYSPESSLLASSAQITLKGRLPTKLEL